MSSRTPVFALTFGLMLATSVVKAQDVVGAWQGTLEGSRIRAKGTGGLLSRSTISITVVGSHHRYRTQPR
jgi:hypothetical protein